MKTVISFLLSMAFLLLLAACGGAPDAHVSTPSIIESTEPESSISPVESVPPAESTPAEVQYHVGDTVSTDLYQVTMKNVEFTDKILVCHGEIRKTEKYDFANLEEFFTPTDEPFVDEDGYLLDGIHGFSASKDSDTTYLYYNFEFSFIGKETHSCTYDFRPIVSYADYIFNSDYMAFGRILGEVKFNGHIWFNFASDEYPLVEALGMEVGGFDSDLKPLSNDVYEVRGIISVPKAVAEDKDAEITLRLAGIEFVVQ